MKKLCFAALTALTLMGCNEKLSSLSDVDDEDAAVVADGSDNVTLTVDFAGSDAETKIMGTSYVDKKINKVQLFIFDQLGGYEASTVVEGSTTASITCRSGIKRVVAIVNAETLGDVRSFDDLAHRRADLKTLTLNNEVMVGQKLDTLRADKNIAMHVDRLVAKVSLNSISVSFDSKEHLGKTLTVRALYLINVAGNRCYLADDAPTIWYNAGAYRPGECSNVLYEAMDDFTVKSGDGAVYESHYFYCYPNGLGNQTRLVVEAEMDGQIFYYPINLGAIEPGVHYKCSIEINHVGSYSPDVPVVEGSVTAYLSASSWRDVVIREEGH